MMNKLPTIRRSAELLAILLEGLAVGGILLGCSSQFANNNTTPASLPGAGQQTTSNTYTGTQGPGYWTLTLDDKQKVFSYETVTNATSSTTPTQGEYSVSNGISNFGATSSGASAGMAIEIPSRSTTLRPGDNTTAPVSLVQQSSCFAVTGNIRYIYAGMLAGHSALDVAFPAYGSFVVSTSTDGKSWHFGDVAGYLLPTAGSGIASGTNAQIPFPPLFSGACQAANGEGVVSLSANPGITASPTTTFAFHPAGYFVMDQPPTELVSNNPSWVGFAMPGSALSATVITAGTYSGFVYEQHTRETNVVTRPMSLSPAPGLSATLAGGPYANDDPTQTPTALYTLKLGSQDATLHGVFPNATLVVPDPEFQCAVSKQGGAPVKAGFDVDGNPICSTTGVAVVGNPDGKYAIYFTGLDGTAGTGGPQGDANAYPLQMYLYQQ